MIMNGWSTAALGNCDEGISEIHQGLELLQSTGGKRSLPYYHALLAELNIDDTLETAVLKDNNASPTESSNSLA